MEEDTWRLKRTRMLPVPEELGGGSESQVRTAALADSTFTQ